MGKPSPGIDLAILNTENERVIDEEGEISVLITPTSENLIFQGYRKNVAGKAQLIRPERIDKQGQRWYSTGDRAIMDQEGYLWYVGRDDDVIKSSGYRIGPFEVESALKVPPPLSASTDLCRNTLPWRNRRWLVHPTQYAIPSSRHLWSWPLRG